jgi:hypothetical protein
MADPPTPTLESVPIKMIWPTPIIVGAVVLMMVLLLTMNMELPILVHSRGVRWWNYVMVLGPAVLTVAAWVLIEVRSTRYLQPSLDKPLRWTLHHLRRVPLLVIGFIVVIYGTRYLFGYRASGTTWLILMFHESMKVTLLYCCWLALTFGVVSFARMRQQAEHLLVAQKSLVEAKLTQLRAQLRPHFLFNTLNTISALMQVDIQRADRMVTQLGDLLRANLNASERNVVPLAEELQLLRQYGAIMEERFAGRVTITWNIDDAAAGALVPTMLLQPLLENAFKHGVERSAGSDHIEVVVQHQTDSLRIAVRNSQSRLASDHREGWGLRNCRERLQLLYGSAATLTLTGGDGVTATVILPRAVSA